MARVSGPRAGLIAAAGHGRDPATVALNRGNISDTLLILVLVLAWLVYAPPGQLRRRIADSGILAALAGLVSLSWMTIVSLSFQSADVPCRWRPA